MMGGGGGEGEERCVRGSEIDKSGGGGSMG